VALSEIDRNLLERCIQRKPRAWEDFVDRFMGVVVHVIQHTAAARGIRLKPEDRDDFCSDVFLNIVKDDFAVLRHFRGQSSLATYLAVIVRRIVVKKLLHLKVAMPLDEVLAPVVVDPSTLEQRITDRDEVHRLMEGLSISEAQVVHMYHLEGKAYQEIQAALGISANSIGPILSRARAKMRGVSGK
jgi:RNA polymerase sigma-70 factor (ECF subfamily)